MSLAEITPEQVRAALPESGARTQLGRVRAAVPVQGAQGPQTDLRQPHPWDAGSQPVNATVPLPLDSGAIRRALDSPDPAVALAVALVAFHALTAKQLAQAATHRYRRRPPRPRRPRHPPGRPGPGHASPPGSTTATETWPASINPHLFIGRRSAPRLTPVGKQFPWKGTELRPQALREDRILQEIHATGGDVRRICDLFGINIETAMRYAAHPRTPRPGSTDTRRTCVYLSGQVGRLRH